MATFQFAARRLILAGGFAVAVAAAPAIAVFAVPTADTSVPVACAGGEEEDLYIPENCVPHTVPNAGSPFQAIPGNPSLPAVTLPGGGGAIPCTGHNSGECIGLAEEAQAEGPQPVPRATFGQ
ncbi:MAG: intersectin-EH binding protein Ibp1 [Mycobacterium sp.]